jgi:hypothetical protein
MTVHPRHYRIRIAATDADGHAVEWRVISGRGGQVRNHGHFNSLSAAVAFVEAAKKASPTPGEPHGSATKPRP